MSTDWLEEESRITASDIRREVAIDPDDDKALGLTGLEPLILALALKAVTGIVSGFAGRASYDLWKKARTRKQIEELRKGLHVNLGDGNSDPIDETTIRHDLVETLVAQGLTPGQASGIVDKALMRIKSRLRTNPV